MSERMSPPKEMKKTILRGIRTALLASGSATKVELSEKLGVSFPTIGKCIDQLVKTGELVTVGLDDSSGGRRARRYAYDPDYQLGATLFLEKTETQYTIYNLLGEVKERGECAGFLQAETGTLAEQIELLIERYPRIRSLAFGVPGSVDGGRITFIPGYEKFHGFDLKGDFEARFGLPVVVENDMNAAVLGYYDKLNLGEKNHSLVYLYFGQNGPGAGILINGDVVRGSTSFSGEVSFVPLYDGRNFRQAMAEAGGKGAPAREAGVDAVSRLVAALAAILNPNTVIFVRDEVDVELLEAIAARSSSYIAGEHLPKLTASDWKEDYSNGLKKLGLDLMVRANDDHI